MVRITLGWMSALMLPSLVAVAEPARIDGAALKQMVAGKTVVLHTAIGAVPISYRGDGTMSGGSKQLAMYTGRERDNGRWWVTADQLCQQWDSWLERRSYCFTLRVDGKLVHWRRSDGTTGTASIASH